MHATVVITTKNRRDDLRHAVLSAITQSALPEVLVIDDGSTDGSTEMLQRDYPSVRVERVETSQGYIAQRNRAAQLAGGDVIVSIDDDAAFSTPHVVRQILAEFCDHRIGAVASPFINVNRENILLQSGPAGDRVMCVDSYIGTAHAVRRGLFNQLGGYRTSLFHQGEETDFCLRLLQSGHVVRLGRADPIHHFESPHRDLRRMDLYGRRNDILIHGYNTPLPHLLLHLPGVTIGGLRLGLKLRRPRRMLHGLWMGYTELFRSWSQRNPVSQQTFKLFRELKKSPMPLDEVIKRLSPMQQP